MHHILDIVTPAALVVVLVYAWFPKRPKKPKHGRAIWK